MKTIRTLLILSGALMLTVSCKKKEYSSTSPAPVYPLYFNGTINGAAVNLQAGANNYYMYASYALDGNGVYDYAGELRDKNTSTGSPSSLKISIKDYRKYSVAPTSIDSTIMPGYYSFSTLTGGASKYSVQFFDSLYNGTGTTYSWDFGDGTTSTQNRPTHIYSRPGVYNVSLLAQSGSCTSSLVNDVMVGQLGGLVQLSFNASGTTVNTVTMVTTSGGGTMPYSFHWDFGDGNTTTVTTPTCSYTYAGSGVYPITLTRTDAVGTVQICSRNYATQTATTCYMNFYPTLIAGISNPTKLADVSIEWVDANGLLWTSQNANQTIFSVFKILSVDPYQNNTSGQPTKKIHAKVSCILTNGSNSMPFSGDIVFSVAYL